MWLSAAPRGPERAPRSPWSSVLPLALAVFVGVGQAQRAQVAGDPIGLRRPEGSPPAAKAHSPAWEPVGWGRPARPALAEPRTPRVPPPAPGWRRWVPGQRPPAPWPRAAPAQAQTRRTLSTQRVRLSGKNVCRGQCCPGWTTANSTNHCIKQLASKPTWSINTGSSSYKERLTPSLPAKKEVQSQNHVENVPPYASLVPPAGRETDERPQRMAMISAVCQPPCQNRGSCSRPQLCVCRSGFRGSRCEEIIPEEEFDSQNSKPVPRRSAEDVPSLRGSHAAQGSIGPWTRPPSTPLTRTLGGHSQPRHFQQHVGPSRTVRLHPASSSRGQLTSSTLPAGPGLEQRDGVQQAVYLDRSSSPWGMNLTEKIRKIKIIFTPTVCRQTCVHGRCTHSCERGRTTTLYSQGGRDPQSGFRVFHGFSKRPCADFCQIPCLNGGRCVGRDECRCPSNATGKFCHLSVPPPGTVSPTRGTRHRDLLKAHSSRQSTFTLPLSNQLASVNPSLVKVHIRHPPEASVQVHQVARVRAEAPENSLEISPPGRLPNTPHSSWDSNSIPPARPAGVPLPAPPEALRPPGLLGRCYLSSVNGQCAHPLLELTAQEDCCGSVGAFWGVTACAPCPPRPASPVIYNGQLECPQGFKRLNLTHCQDIDECLMLGLCQDSECVNTRGSYLCTCRPGLMLDPSRSRCVSDKAVSMKQGLCFRSSGPGVCSLPLVQRITKQICCCSRVGKAWGSKCEECPLPGTEAFREICPAGHGYTYSSSDIRLSMRKAEAVELARPSREPEQKSSTSLPGPDERQQLRETTGTWLEAGTTSAEGDSRADQVIASVTQSGAWLPGDAMGRPTPPLPGQGTAEAWGEKPVTSAAEKQVALGSPEIDRCGSGATNICGPGTCVNLADGYRCICSPGYRLHPSQAYCTDDNECLEDPCLGRGRCVNHVGSYSCICYPGYELAVMGLRQECKDIDECLHPGTCPHGRCINSPGSFTCLACEEGYRAQSGNCVDVNECLSPGVCAHGRCINLDGSFQCSCEQGYKATSDEKGCQDVDECASRASCPTGLCLNTEGSFTCTACESGYWVNTDGTACEDLDECAFPGVCPSGVCTNTAGSFSCRDCETGYQPSPLGHTCEDVDECKDPQSNCLQGECRNTAGSYQCICPPGFWLDNGTMCKDVDECVNEEHCAPRGECLNTQGSFFCLCAPGFASTEQGTSCQDVDECADTERCLEGHCVNTDGSFSCLCKTGFQPSLESGECVDIDECEDYGDSPCDVGRCENSPGSYHCIRDCQPGFQMAPSGDCIDIDECANITACGSHGFCDNTDGSFRCLCDQGFETSPSGWECVDVNECELMLAVCGAALCENVEGSFLCLCTSDAEEFNAQEGRCRPRTAGGHSSPEASPGSNLPGPVRMECYAGQSGQLSCATLLSRNTTQAECCCTQGASWGVTCEPCPSEDSVEFSEICPSGKGYIPMDGTWVFGQTTYTDADECVMFGSALCPNGRCLNTVPGYMCLCNAGYHYDASRRRCEDQDECEDVACEDGECVNTEGSFHCSCSPPLTLDSSQQRCVNGTNSAATGDLLDHDIHMDVCWRTVTHDVCSQPLHGHHTTYTECCCQGGGGWGQQCALCPPRHSEVYAQLCNVARIEAEREAGVHFRPSYEYGPGPEDLHYGLYGPDVVPFYSDLAAEDSGPELPFPHTADHTRDPSLVVEPPLLPSALQPHYIAQHTEPQAGFEGLQAEECGILSGCENGRCVRVQEGYTCDCFEGFQLDMAHMACVDVNECHDLNGPATLCAHGHCENTEGSFRCHCAPGYVAAPGPPYCILKEQ